MFDWFDDKQHRSLILVWRKTCDSLRFGAFMVYLNFPVCTDNNHTKILILIRNKKKMHHHYNLLNFGIFQCSSIIILVVTKISTSNFSLRITNLTSKAFRQICNFFFAHIFCYIIKCVL